jgi:hypothetical protein
MRYLFLLTPTTASVARARSVSRRIHEGNSGTEGEGISPSVSGANLASHTLLPTVEVTLNHSGVV